MVVAIVQVGIRLEGIESLKDKRAILRSLIERIRHNFQVAIAEVDDHDLWGNATLGITAVSNAAIHLESVLSKVRDEIEGNPALEVADWWQEIERR
jgi:uncharacterized protein